MAEKIQALPKSLWRFYIKYAFRGNWGILIPWALLLIYLRLGMVIYPLTMKWLVAMFEYPLTSVESFIVANLPTVLLIVLWNVSMTVCGAINNVLAAYRHNKMRNQISEKLTDYLQHQSAQYWTERKSGQLNSQINYVGNGINVLGDLLQIVMLAVTMAINVWLIWNINIWLTAIFAVMFFGRLIYSLIMMKPVKKAARDASSASSRLSGHIVDSLSNSYVVRLFAGARAEHEYLKKPRIDSVSKNIKSQRMQMWFWAPFGFLWDIGYGLTLITALYLFATGQLLLSAIVFTISVYEHVTMAISNLVNIIPKLVEDLSSASRAYNELSAPIAITDVPNAPDLVVKHGKIEFKNVWFKYKRKWILRDLNLTIKPGERVGLVGASGAGKTTLVNLLMRFYEPTRGEILIDGQNIRNVSQESLRRAIGFIPQEATLFDRTLRENIKYGRPDATDAQMRNAAKRASADSFIMASDKKYDSLVGERGIKLSGGQRQRIAIARAFLKDAPILVLDEVTFALDSETEVAIQKSFEELASGRTTIAIAHRLSTLRNMDRIVVMKDGNIIEQGSHHALTRRRGEYARLWRMQSGGFIQE